ncbi:PREDICTED: uncharacterized protein LOC109174056 [Ipomoea nil]|uniref:uncharacterized protein LOC109174056 n=1 Tax=Ipomoea nil TaxID=35883 RepID=UPI000901DF4C|nr:PREDICTED: uncharacterized protein LOC109174056 [Ipomoea nil]
MPMQGYPFTWKKREGTENWSEERLDKVLVTETWRNLNAQASVLNLMTRRSDHSALFLGIRDDIRGGGRRAKSFRFEMSWLHDEGCREVVEGTWEEGRNMGMQDYLQLCWRRLTSWGGDLFHKFGEQIKRLRKEQDSLRGRRDLASLAEFRRLEAELCRLEAMDDSFWKQRAKQHCLQGADANTSFFHRYASDRRKKNTMNRIKSVDGVWVDGNAMNQTVMDYFNGVFSSGNPPDEAHTLFAMIQPRVTQAQNETLLSPFTCEEVKNALFAMFSDKSPGPDGMNPGFYQHFWDVVVGGGGGCDVSAFIINCLSTSSFPEGLNNTNVVLIPKKKSPEYVTDLRPIALSNVVYRVMAKMIANRMKPLMEGLISDSQSAFIPDRLITDNILLAAEDGMGFLRKMLTALGFNVRWIDLIMYCVTTVSYEFLINGLPSGQQAQQQGKIYGCRVAKGAPPISHLFFADDSLLFFKENVDEAGEVKRCLMEYETLSGQAVNYHKSSVCFSKNTTEECRDQVAQLLGVPKAINFGKYLGLPSFIGRRKRAVLSYIEDKIKQRIVCLAIQRAMNKYWWGSGVDCRIHWKAWDKLCVPKKYGGLGFKDLRAFNLAMLGKQGWRFLVKPESLVARVYKARYYPGTSFEEAALGNNPSFCWRSIFVAHSLICGGIRRRIGDGNNTLIWGHPWLLDGPNPMIQTDMPQELAGSKVVVLIDQDTGTLDPHILRDLFMDDDAVRINRIPICPDYSDTWYWQGDPNGNYTVKGGYRLVVVNYEHRDGGFSDWLRIWKMKVPPKWKLFLWKALSDVLPTTTNLIMKRVEIDPVCSMCTTHHEYAMHALVSCVFSQAVWRESSLPIMHVMADSFEAWFLEIMKILTSNQLVMAAAILYYIWRARNQAVWEHTLPMPKRVVHAATTAWQAWSSVHGGIAAVNPPVAAATVGDGLPRAYVDAGYHASTGRATAGAVVLSSEGEFMASFNMQLPDCLSPLMAEALACKEALSWLKDKGILSLRDDYGSIVPAIRVQKSGLTYVDLNNILSDHERALKHFEEQRQSLLVTANVTQKYNSSTSNRDSMQNNRDTSQNRGQGNYRYMRGNGNRSNNGGYRQNLICHFCNFQGHETKFCRKLARFFRDHNVFEAPQSQTYASGPSINSSVSGMPPSQSWLFDNGASHHSTTSPMSLPTFTVSSGPDQVNLGDGNSLSITHTSSTILPTPSTDLSLTNVLCVPKLRRNLVSVAKLCQTDNVSVEFFHFSFSVKDLHTGGVPNAGKKISMMFTS